MIIAKRGVKLFEPLTSRKDIPDFKKLRFMARLLVNDVDGVPSHLEYVFYFKETTYSVDMFTDAEFKEFTAWMNGEFKKLNLHPKCAQGTIQNFSGVEDNEEENNHIASPPLRHNPNS